MSEASAVSETAKREAVRASSGGWDWVDTTVWTERMLAALENGVTGGKWYSLMDKVYSRRVLEASWQRVRRNRGAAGALTLTGIDPLLLRKVDPPPGV